MTLFSILAAVLVASSVATGLMRRYAIAHGVLDIPNSRSSHRVPTPRGGGVAVVLAFLGAIGSLAALGTIRGSVATGLVGAGLLVAVVGFIDDHRSLSATSRLTSHFVAAVWGLAWLGGLPPIVLFGWSVDLGLPGDVVAAVALVWLLNLYNFMDGIDGIAAVESVTTCAGAAIIYSWLGVEQGSVAPTLALAAACMGFLLWNFPPAKIFMGDAGSGFIGITLGLLAVHAASSTPGFLWVWLILLGAFIVDATATLARRIGASERLHEAHRNHAYQHAAARLGGHRTVTLAVGLINLLWLLPWAALVASGRVTGLIGLAIAYAPLIWLALRLGAGLRTPVTGSNPE